MEFYHNGTLVWPSAGEGGRYTMEKTTMKEQGEHQYFLHLDEPTWADAGEYRCVVGNDPKLTKVFQVEFQGQRKVFLT